MLLLLLPVAHKELLALKGRCGLRCCHVTQGCAGEPTRPGSPQPGARASAHYTLGTPTYPSGDFILFFSAKPKAEAIRIWSLSDFTVSPFAYGMCIFASGNQTLCVRWVLGRKGECLEGCWLRRPLLHQSLSPGQSSSRASAQEQVLTELVLTL